MSDDEIVNATETTRIDLRAMVGTTLAIKQTGVRRNIAGPPPNEASECVVLDCSVELTRDAIADGLMVVSELHLMFWRNVRAKLRSGYWVVGKIEKGHTAWIFTPATADEMEAAKNTIHAYNTWRTYDGSDEA